MDDAKVTPKAFGPSCGLVSRSAAADHVDKPASLNRATLEPSDFIPMRLVHCPSGGTMELNRPEMIAGRHSEAELRLLMPDVSRRHCRFVFRQGQWQIIDLQSTNGVFVNEARVDQALLHQKDIIRIGSYVFQVEFEKVNGQHPLSATTLGSERDADILPAPQPDLDLAHRKAS